MKIKRKAQKNLPQLIEWGFKNDVINKEYVCNEHKAKSVIFNLMGWAEFSDEFSYNPHDTFTIEVEEEITEDTEFEKLYYTTILSRIVESSCTTIQSSLKHIAVEPIAFYILNDDLTLTLIWRDGKLVE